VAGGANNEKVPKVLVKDDLGRSPGIGASNNDGEWVLAFGRLRPACGRRLACRHLTGGKPKIALLQFGERRLSRYRGCRRIGRPNQNSSAQASDDPENSGSGCGFHREVSFSSESPIVSRAA